MSSNNGWVKSHRKILDTEMASNLELLGFFNLLQLRANYYPTTIKWKGKPRKLLPGQLIISTRQLAEALGVDQKKIHRWLMWFESRTYLTREVTHRGQIITLCNWDENTDIKNDSDSLNDSLMTHSRLTDDSLMTQHKEFKNKEIKNQENTPPPNLLSQSRPPPASTNEEEEEEGDPLSVSLEAKSNAEADELLKFYFEQFASEPEGQDKKFKATYRRKGLKFDDIKKRIERLASDPFLRCKTKSINRVWDWQGAVIHGAKLRVNAQASLEEDRNNGILQDEDYFRTFADETNLDQETFLAWLKPKPKTHMTLVVTNNT